MRFKKALKNLIFNVLQQVVNIIVNFIMPPILVSTFGSTLNGLVSTIRQIMQYVQLTGAGIAQASTFAMYKPIADKDYKSLNGIYNATRKMFTRAGNVFSAITLLVAIIYPLTVRNQVDYSIAFALVLVIGISGASEFYLCGKYNALLSANQENYVVAIAQTIGSLTNLILLIVLVRLKQNVVVAELGMSAVYLCRIVILTVYAKRKYKYLDLTVAPTFEKISQRNDAIVHQVSTLVVMGSSTLIVSLILGLKEASVFAVYLIVFQGINTICSIISTAIYASFGEVIAKGQRDVLIRTFNIYEFVYYIVITILFSCTYLLIMPFIEIYTVNMTDINYIYPTLAKLFILVGIANNIRIPTSTIVTSAGHFKETKWRAVLEMTLNVVGQFVFGKMFGLNGILLGCVLSFSYRTFDFIFYAHKHILKTSSLSTFKKLFINLVASIVVVFLLQQVIDPNIYNYLTWIKYGIVYFVAISLFVLLVNVLFDRKTFNSTFNVVKSLFIKG